jgi:hypothetical protein
MLALVAGLALAGPGRAADVRITEMKAYLFLENSGRLSDNILGQKVAFTNVSTGGGAAKEPASNILLEFVFAGDRNTAPKFATALVNVTQSGKEGRKSRTAARCINRCFSKTPPACRSRSRSRPASR